MGTNHQSLKINLLEINLNLEEFFIWKLMFKIIFKILLNLKNVNL